MKYLLEINRGFYYYKCPNCKKNFYRASQTTYIDFNEKIINKLSSEFNYCPKCGQKVEFK